MRQPRCLQHEPPLLAARCGSLVACSTSHRCLQHDAAASCVPTAVWRCRCNWIGRKTCHCSKWWWVCEKIFVPAQADAFRRRNGQVSASRFFLWVCLADLVAVLWHAGQLVLSGEQAGGLRGCRWLCGPAGLGTRNCTGECADGPAGGCLCGCIWLCCLGMPCHQELDQGMRRWASWWLALQQPAGGRSQMADGEGREGRWWPVGGLARTKPAALRATRLHPCVVTLGLASNTPRRRPLNILWPSRAQPVPAIIMQLWGIVAIARAALWIVAGTGTSGARRPASLGSAA